jgi:hypothetical protein
MATKQECWAAPDKDQEELDRMSQFVRDITERIGMEFHCTFENATDAAFDLYAFLELMEYKKRKKKISPSTADAGLIQFSKN